MRFHSPVQLAGGVMCVCVCVCVPVQIVVNAIVDTLKTAFPRPDAQSPTEDEGETDGLKISSEKKSR